MLGGKKGQFGLNQCLCVYNVMIGDVLFLEFKLGNVMIKHQLVMCHVVCLE